jgi:hypothetical protein
MDPISTFPEPSRQFDRSDQNKSSKPVLFSGADLMAVSHRVFTNNTTTYTMQKHHVCTPKFAKNPRKTPIHHAHKNAPKTQFFIGGR